MNERIHQGLRLRQAREKLGLKQKEVAERIGITPAGLSEIENGRNKLSNEVSIKLNSLGININWLLNGEGEMLVKNGQKTQAEEYLEAFQSIAKQLIALRRHYVQTVARLKDRPEEDIRKEIDDIFKTIEL